MNKLNCVNDFIKKSCSISFPSKSDFIKYWVYNKDEIICSGYFIDELAKKFDIHKSEVFSFITDQGFVTMGRFDKESFESAKDEYYKRKVELPLQFQNFIFTKYNIFGEKAKLLLAKCQTYCDKSFSEDVEEMFSDFVELIRT